MEANIIRIGNSRGVVIPSAVLKTLGLTERSTVDMTVGRNGLIIKKTPARAGWATAARKMHENGEDKLLLPDVFEDETFDGWEW